MVNAPVRNGTKSKKVSKATLSSVILATALGPLAP
jgi:hypothetical protein